MLEGKRSKRFIPFKHPSFFAFIPLPHSPPLPSSCLFFRFIHYFFSSILFNLFLATIPFMTMFNPFSSWADAKNDNGSTPPSIFGALPYPSAPSNSTIFYLTSFNPTIFNCSVVGTQGQVYFQVVTDPHNPGYTVLRNASGKNVALVEWLSPPLIEIRGVLSKQNISEWLKLASDRSSRSMEVRGHRYTWVPHGKSVGLHAGGSTSTLLARITRSQGTIMLEMTSDAIQFGILDSVVTVAFLLQCGRNID
ncbi:hypothetical protein AX17_004663 [Amanita inopinata Kibby_2008]|nr:hypothetical protein AX17_004663 [Amanita inopinata Kibby_2008]